MEDWSVGQSSGTDALLDAEPTKIEFLITLRNSTSSSSSTSLAVKQPPPSTAVKNKRKADDTVLEEDAYISALDTIIQRDFFPDLPKLRAQISYVEAAQQGNDEKMQEAVRLYAAATAEQKASSSSSVSDESTLSSQVECDAQKLSLDRFQAKYTSEDNVSFSEIIEQQNQDLKKKYNWLYDASSQRLLLGPAQEIRSITDGKGSSRLAITGEGDDPVGTWKYVQKNHLLWYPEGRGSVYDDDKTVRGGFKKIKYNNTRLPEPSGDSEV
jgi:protein DGCR14